MRASYNGVEFQNIRLRNLQMFAEKDPTGYDVTMTRVELEISFQWSPYATSSIPAARLINNDGLTPALCALSGSSAALPCPLPVLVSSAVPPGHESKSNGESFDQVRFAERLQHSVL
jgi:hypothetical protein